MVLFGVAKALRYEIEGEMDKPRNLEIAPRMVAALARGRRRESQN